MQHFLVRNEHQLMLLSVKDVKLEYLILNRTFKIPYSGRRRPKDADILRLVSQQIGGNGGFRLIFAAINHCLKMHICKQVC